MQKRGISRLPSTRFPIGLYSKKNVLLHLYFRRYCIQTSYLGNICHFPSHFSQKSRSKWVFGQKNCKILFFLYFCTGNWISWFSRGRMSLWRHRHRRLGLLVLYLVSIFRGDSKLNIGTKLSIIRGSILKISGEVDTPPPPPLDVLQKMAQLDEG